MKDLNGRVVIVTGGRATAQLFADSGATVYGLSRSKPQGEFSFTHVCCDVTDKAALDAIFERVYSEQKRIDCVINNAGLGIAGAVEYTSDKAVESISALNLGAVEHSCRSALRYLRESKGAIINLSSVAAIMPIAFQTYYSATKAAVLVYSRALAQEVKPFGVRVTAVLPGDTKTAFTSSRVIENEKNEYSGRVERSVSKMAKDEQNGVGAEKVAKVIFKAYSKKNPKPSYIVGFPYKLVNLLNKLLPQRFVDYILFKLYAK